MKEFLFGAAAIVLAGAAVAQTTAPAPAHQGHPGGAALHAAPGAGIGRAQTRDEVVANVREHFARLDTNRDNFLTKEEAEAGRAAMRSMRMERRAERRGNRAERLQGRDPAVAFDRLDSNKDGAISRDEFAKGREVRIERRVERQAAPGAPGAEGRRMHFRGMGGGMIGAHMFAMADANKDNRVSLQEATNAAVQHFDMGDTNRDGRITPEERRTMRRQMIEKRRAPKAG